MHNLFGSCLLHVKQQNLREIFYCLIISTFQFKSTDFIQSYFIDDWISFIGRQISKTFKVFFYNKMDGSVVLFPPPLFSLIKVSLL